MELVHVLDVIDGKTSSYETIYWNACQDFQSTGSYIKWILVHFILQILLS